MIISKGSVLAAAIVVVFLFPPITASVPEQQQPPPVQPIPPILLAYQPATTERLKNPEDSEWLMVRRTYDGWGYSPLDQVTPGNVHRLQPAWIVSTGQNGGHEAPPIVNNGVMFVATPGNQVIALDATTGRMLWRYRRPLADDASALHRTSRGVALYSSLVFFAAADAVLVAIDARTGREIWATKVDETSNGYYMTAAPLVADGKVMVGVSGGDLGIRGFVAAYDTYTGKEVWKAYTVPAPGEPGSETWPDGDEWKTGGGATWVTGNYDMETNLVYWGTGNGAPWMGDQRPGDNLYTASTVAIDAGTGEIKGYFQYHPNDSWNWDEVSPPLLLDFQRDGKPIKGLVNAARNGYLWFLERAGGGIDFVEAKPYVLQNVFGALDPVTGRPDIHSDRKPGTGRTVDHCPSVWGGKNWPPAAFSPQTRMIYIPANNNLCGISGGLEVEYTPGRPFIGAATSLYLAPFSRHVGEIQAWSVDTGEHAWTHEFEMSPNWGPILATGGGLVFSGGTNDRIFRAFDASNGQLLWEAPTNSGVIGVPVSFAVAGKQYIAVQSGWGLDAEAMQGDLNRISPGDYPEVPEGGAIWVFAIN